MSFLTLTLMLFFIIDPIGNIPLFLSCLKGQKPAVQRRIVFREFCIALGVILFFMALGEYIFVLLEISETTVRIGSGVILFLIALRMLFPAEEVATPRWQANDPYLVPLAIPAIAGPSMIATVMLFAHLEPSVGKMVGATLVAWGLSLGILLMSPRLQKVMTNNGLVACERLMGLILILLASQRFLEGIQLFVRSLEVG